MNLPQRVWDAEKPSKVNVLGTPWGATPLSLDSYGEDQVPSGAYQIRPPISAAHPLSLDLIAELFAFSQLLDTTLGETQIHSF